MDGKGSDAHIDNEVVLNLGAYEFAITFHQFCHSLIALLTLRGGGVMECVISIGI